MAIKTKKYTLGDTNNLGVYYGFGGQYDSWVDLSQTPDAPSFTWGWQGVSASAYKFRAKLTFNTGNIIIGGKCTIKVDAPLVGSSYPQKSIAVISTKDLGQYEVSTGGNGWTGSDSIGTATPVNDAGSSPSGSWSGTVHYTFKNLALTANTTYYIYLMKDSGTVSTMSDTGRVQTSKSGISSISVTLEYPEYTKIATPTLTISTTSPGVGTSVTFSWTKPSDGTNNPVTGYRLYYTTASSVNTSQYKTVSASATSVSYTPSSLGYKKGQKVNFWLQAIGVTNYWSNYSSAKSYTIVNTAPTAPNFTISGILSYDSAIKRTITFNNISSTDVDGDNLKYYYCIDNSETPPDSGYTLLSSSSFSNSLDNTTQKIHIMAYDGTVYSAITTKTIPVNTEPEIISLTLNSKTYDNIGGGQSAYNLNIEAVYNKNSSSISSYNWQIETEENIWKTISENSQLEYDLADIALGYQIKIRLQIKDTNEDVSAWKTLTLDAVKGSYTPTDTEIGDINISLNRHISENEYLEGKNAILEPQYFNKKLTLSFNYPTFEGKDYMFEHKFIIQEVGKAEQIITFNRNATGQYSYSFEIDCDFGAEIGIIIRTEWSNGSSDYLTKTESSSTVKMIRLPVPVFGSTQLNTLKCQPVNWNIYTKGATLSFSFINPLGNPNFFFNDTGALNGGIFYDIKVNFGTDSKPVLLSGGPLTSDNLQSGVDTFGIIYSTGVNNNFGSLFAKLGKDFNKIYNVGYEVVLKNIYGEYINNSIDVTDNSTNYSIITTSKPVQEFTVLKQRIGTTRTSFIEVESESTSFINPGEYIFFDFDKEPFDENDIIYNADGTTGAAQTITAYRVFYSYDNSIFNKLGDIAYIYNRDKDQIPYYYIRSDLTIPNDSISSRDLYLQVCVVAKDGTNTEELSDPVALRSIKIGRRASPKVKIKNIQLNNYTLNEEKRENLKVAFNFEDYGGNDLGYGNFFRQGTEGIKIVAKSADSLTDLADATSENFFRTYSEISANPTIEMLDGEANTIGTKKYLRIQIYLQTDDSLELGQTTNILLTDYIFYNAGPTMSHRAHWVGINVIDADGVGRDDTEVFRVNSYSNKKFIILNGENESDSSVKNTIIINLSTGEIDGALIDGGEW